MGKSILTAKQLDFLELAQTQPSITKKFYLTGGTALSEFYFQHRLSEDIDLFTEKEEVNPQVIEAFYASLISAKVLCLWKLPPGIDSKSFLLQFS